MKKNIQKTSNKETINNSVKGLEMHKDLVKSETFPSTPQIQSADKYVFIFSYDRVPPNTNEVTAAQKNSGPVRNDIPEVLEEKNDPKHPKEDIVELIKSNGGKLIIYPNSSTIIFSSSQDEEYWIPVFVKSEATNKLRLAFFLLGEDLNKGYLNKWQDIINKDLFEKVYTRNIV